MLQKRLLETIGKNTYQNTTYRIIANNREVISTIDPNVKFLEFILNQDKNLVSIEVFLLPKDSSGSERSILEVHVFGNSTAFSIWNAIRKIIEINCLPNELKEASFPESRNSPKSEYDFKTESKILDIIINRFNPTHRKIIRLWINGSDTKFICMTISKENHLSIKTIRNIIWEFRKQLPEGSNKFYRRADKKILSKTREVLVETGK